MSWHVDAGTPEDFAWIKPIYLANKKILGPFDVMLWRWSNVAHDKRSQFLVIRPFAFAHFRRKRDGSRTLYEIGVTEEMKRKGMASLLLSRIGYPMTLKTDADNAESNAFYKALNFYLMGRGATKAGKAVNYYQRFE